MNGNDIQLNYVRIANVWLEDEYRQVFYNSSNVKLRNGVPVQNFGDISGTGIYRS